MQPTPSPSLALLRPGEYVVYSAYDGGVDRFGNPSTALYALPAASGPPVSWIAGALPGAALSPDGQQLA